MSDVESRAGKAALLALQGQRVAAIAEYLGILADIESGQSFYGEAVLRSDLAHLLHEAGDPRETQQLTKAVALFQRQGDPSGLIDACLRLARLHRHSATNALYWVDRAVTAAERSANPQELCRPLGLRGELLNGLGRFDDALISLDRAVRLPGGDAFTDQLAVAQIGAGHPREGLATLMQSLSTAERAEGDGAAERVVMVRMRLADAYRSMGDRTAALEQLERAAEREGDLADGFVFGALLDRLGAALLESGDVAGAIGKLESAIRRSDSEGHPDPGLLASLHHNLGNALGAIGHHAGAVRSFEHAIELAHRLDWQIESRALFGKANSAVVLDDPATAHEAYEEARGLATQHGDRQLEAACMDSLGALRSKGGEPGMAVDLHKRAALLHGEIGDHLGRLLDLLNLVQAYLLLEEGAVARRALDEATEIAREQLPRTPWQYALTNGRVLALEREWPQARAAFDAAIAQLEAERVNLGTPEDQQRWARYRVEAFELAIVAAFEVGDGGDALAVWSYLEGNKARFLNAIAERRARLPVEMSEDDRRAYLAATDRLSDLRFRRRDRPDVSDPGLDAEIEAAERVWLELEALVVRLRKGHEAPPVPGPSPEELAECLSPGEAAIALHVSARWVGAACLGRERGGAIWFACETDPGLTLDDLSRAVLGRAEGDPVTPRTAWQDLVNLQPQGAAELVTDTCAKLGKWIWPLVERVLKDRADSLVLMPGRGLNVLPLHAARTSDGRLAMDRWSVRYAPSLRLLARAGPPGPLPAERFLGQAVNPTENLPFAEAEATAIRGIWAGGLRKSLSGPLAQPDAVLQLFEQSDLLHFAGHGAFDPVDPLQSRLLCADGPSGSVLTLEMLLDRVPAARSRVVLLSACDTGRVQAGDALNDQLGLPGSLLVAGSSAVLATHWPVADLAAALVLSRCIELWEQQPLDLERALAGALSWLRSEATVGVIRAWIEDRLQAMGTDEQLQRTHAQLAFKNKDDLLLAGEYYWAPFHVTGRAVRARP